MGNQGNIVFDKYHKKALSCIEEGKNLFITGKAGTGKTTVLREITATCKRKKKNVVVLAPTGVAAKHAGGVTIHSFLHLPLGPYIPGMRVHKLYALKEDEIQMVNKIDIMIIDEVSMVRCDMLDEIDDVLKHYRKNNRPFGGIQIVMFGDLYQLMPVATEEDWEKLKEKYASPYFFSSKILETMDYSMFELKKVHRQDDRNFITLLNNVRLGKISYAELKELEGRYNKNFVPSDDEGYIRLTTHNRRSKAYNNKMLEGLSGQTYEYKAYIEDFFPQEEWPTNYVLELKRGARVMFVRNDNEGGQYVNGTLGKVISLGDRRIVVRTDDGNIVDVERQTWDFYRYKVNKKTKEIEAILCGSFKQYPLKLAWAVTIHKSQGLTFDKVIIDAGRAFTYGQVYVALSRCRKFHGIVLVSPITSKIIKTDPIVTEYMKNVNRIIVEGDDDKDESEKHLSLGTSKDKTHWMIRDGLTIEQIAEQSGERIEIVYGHIAKLIESGDVDIHKFLSDRLIKSIESALMIAGFDAHLKDIREHCIEGTKFAEIRMVQADIKRRGLEDQYIAEEDEEVEDKEENNDDDDWSFVDSVPYTKASKWFTAFNCRVVLSTKGYYLEVGNEFIKLGNYPKGYDMSSGNVWIKKPLSGSKDIRMVHEVDGKSHLIGYIREMKKKIIFTDPDGEGGSITFT